MNYLKMVPIPPLLLPHPSNLILSWKILMWFFIKEITISFYEKNWWRDTENINCCIYFSLSMKNVMTQVILLLTTYKIHTCYS